MASGSAQLSGAFKQFADKADKKEISTKGVTKWCTDAKVIGKQCSSNNLDICFSGAKTKGKTTLTCDQIPALIAKIAPSYQKDKKLTTPEAAIAEITEKLAGASKDLASGTTKTSKTGGVGKMTDTSQYTGAHKERFGADGKGKGIDGREERCDNSGYVGEYKGQGTHGKK